MQERRSFLRFLGLSASAALLALSGCGKQAPSSTETTVVVNPPVAAASAPAPAPAKVYVVGTDAAYAPFESQNAQGEIVGFDIDVVKAVAEKAGVQVKFENTPWEGIFNALANGDRDLLVSAITITDERKQTMDFSDPYFDARQLIATKADSKIASMADLKKLKVGVQNGTTGDEAVTKLQGKTSTNIKRFESTPLALDELKAGGVDAVVADNGVVAHYIANNSTAGLKMVEDTTFVPEQYGIAVKKGNAELLAKLNKALAEIKADGTYARIYKAHFGVEPPAAATAPAPISVAAPADAAASAAQAVASAATAVASAAQQ